MNILIAFSQCFLYCSLVGGFFIYIDSRFSKDKIEYWDFIISSCVCGFILGFFLFFC